ncbi:MAG: phosphate ABC transporter permease subunit PstC [Euzebyales bacterium]|nr:phosphate ABC transporter permease subunit PstC [Euzebyales bacterium]MBA3620962.1 phosphate ABC transporter permease subunit PstC [Euzebyales bacterium]
MAARTGQPLLRATRQHRGEQAILLALKACGVVSILTTVGIVVMLFAEAGPFFAQISERTFFFGTTWQPFGSNPDNFGVLPLVNGTLLVTAVAMAVAVPLGLGAAMYLSDYASQQVRRVLKPTLEVLAGIPTIVLGLFALTFVTALLRAVFGSSVQIFNAASAGIVMGIMIIPTIASVAQDAMSAVPQGLRDSAYGLGATRRQVVVRVVVPGALSGIVAAVLLGFGRAIGETMIVAIAAGNLPRITVNPFEQIQTMTAYIVQAVSGETPRGTLSYQSIFAVGALLFAMTFGLNIAAQWFVRRFREVY